jgi:hypothetical protein
VRLVRLFQRNLPSITVPFSGCTCALLPSWKHLRFHPLLRQKPTSVLVLHVSHQNDCQRPQRPTWVARIVIDPVSSPNATCPPALVRARAPTHGRIMPVICRRQSGVSYIDMGHSESSSRCTHKCRECMLRIASEGMALAPWILAQSTADIAVSVAHRPTTWKS